MPLNTWHLLAGLSVMVHAGGLMGGVMDDSWV